MARSFAALLAAALLVACSSAPEESPRYPDGFDPSALNCHGTGLRFTPVSEGNPAFVDEWLVFVGGDVTVESARLAAAFGGEVGGILAGYNAFVVVGLREWDAMRMSLDPAVCSIEPNSSFGAN